MIIRSSCTTAFVSPARGGYSLRLRRTRTFPFNSGLSENSPGPTPGFPEPLPLQSPIRNWNGFQVSSAFSPKDTNGHAKASAQEIHFIERNVAAPVRGSNDPHCIVFQQNFNRHPREAAEVHQLARFLKQR